MAGGFMAAGAGGGIGGAALVRGGGEPRDRTGAILAHLPVEQRHAAGGGLLYGTAGGVRQSSRAVLRHGADPVPGGGAPRRDRQGCNGASASRRFPDSLRRA